MSTPAPPTSASLSALPTGSASSAPTPKDPLTRKAVASLLSAADLPHFTLLPPSVTDVPQPCAAASAKPLLSRMPPKARAGRQFLLASPQAELTEDVLVMPSAKAATSLSTATKIGLFCARGTFHLADGSTQTVDVRGPESITNVVRARGFTATSWTLQNGQVSVSFVLAQDQQVVVMLQFLALTTADLSKLPQGLGPAIARTALTKVRAAGLVR